MAMAMSQTKSILKRRKQKTSLTKLSNKRLNKLAKRGKLTKKLKKKDLKQFITERVDPNTELKPTDVEGVKEKPEQPDIPLVEADYDYFAKPGRDFSFLFGIDKGNDNQKQRKRKVERQGASLEEQYEEVARSRYQQTGPEKQMKALLPIITKDKGVVPQMIEQQPEPEAPEINETEVEAEPVIEKPLVPLTAAKLFLQRQQRLEEMKQKMAVLCSALCEDPEANIGNLRELRLMLNECDTEAAITTKKMLIVSMTEAYKDIIPGYPIRVATKTEKEQAAKEETKKLRNFEETLVTNYRKFLEHLELVAKGKDTRSKKRKELTGEGNFMEGAKTSLARVALGCLCDLLATNPHFNFRTEIIACIVPFIAYRDAKMSDTVVNAVKRIFREDKSGEVTLEITRSIGRLVKHKNFHVDPKVLKTFLVLRIKEVYRKEDKYKEKQELKETKRKIMSRRDKKRKKQIGELERELEEAAALTDTKKRLRINTEIINMVFLTYFRILKQAQDSILLPVVLEGLAQFAHLINIEFFDDLFRVLNQLVESEELTYRESLHCVLTAFTILSGQGEALNIDPIRFYRHLYNAILQLHVGCSSEDVHTALKCLDTMISKRKKQITYQRLFAFMKRLSTLALQLPAHSALGILSTLRAFMLTDSKSDILLDTEHEGPGLFLPELDDPEYCNAHNTALFELHNARRHYHPKVRRYAEHILRGAPSQGAGALPADLARMSPMELQEEFDATDMRFNPPMTKKPKTLKKFTQMPGFLQESITKEADKALNSVALGETTEGKSATAESAMEVESDETPNESETTNKKSQKGNKKSAAGKKMAQNKFATKQFPKGKAKHKNINIGALENL